MNDEVVTQSTELEMAKQMLVEVEEEIAFLEEQKRVLEEYIAELSAEESDNPYWSATDDRGARRLLPMDDIHAALLEGSREEVFYAHYYAPFHYDGYFVSLTEDISPDYLRMYSEAQTRHFAGAIVGLTFVLAKCYEEEGDLIEGIYMPWNGNNGPHASTMKFQNDWAADDKLNRVRGQAKNRMRWVDREYRIAKMRGTVDAFMEKYPYYVPE